MTFKDFCIVVSFTLFLVAGVVELTTELSAFADGGGADAVRHRVLRALANRTDRIATGQGSTASHATSRHATSQMTGGLPIGLAKSGRPHRV